MHFLHWVRQGPWKRSVTDHGQMVKITRKQYLVENKIMKLETSLLRLISNRTILECGTSPEGILGSEPPSRLPRSRHSETWTWFSEIYQFYSAIIWPGAMFWYRTKTIWIVVFVWKIQRLYRPDVCDYKRLGHILYTMDRFSLRLH